MAQTMYCVWQRRFAKRSLALAHIQETAEYKAYVELLETVPNPLEMCSKRTWEVKLKDLRVCLRTLKQSDDERDDV